MMSYLGSMFWGEQDDTVKDGDDWEDLDRKDGTPPMQDSEEENENEQEQEEEEEEEDGQVDHVEEVTPHIKCETCGTDERVWACLECASLHCLDLRKHAIPHLFAHLQEQQATAPRSALERFLGSNTETQHKCTLMLNCQDVHIFCMSCQSYVYPRELSFDNAAEDALNPVAEGWLQVLGLTRLWWNDLPNTTGKSGSRGLKNFGNTCFFTSTVQALVHNRPLGE